MQTSGTFGALSDGMRKTMADHMGPAKVAAPKAPKPSAAPKPAASASAHRRGGHARHGGK